MKNKLIYFLISLNVVGWGLAVALFLGRLQVHITQNQYQTATQSQVQATVNNNYITETMVKNINTNFNHSENSNFNESSMRFIRDVIFSKPDQKAEDLIKELPKELK